MTGATSERNTTGTRSLATDPFAEARQAYENGMPLAVMKRRFHLSNSEAADVAPEEFDDDAQADGVSGY